MNRDILTCFAVLLLAAMPCLAKEKSHAPLPQQLLQAKTVFLAGGPPAVLDKAYEELQKWGRFQVVSNPAQADVVFEFRLKTGPSTTEESIGASSESLTIADAKTKEVLYEDSREYSRPSGLVPFLRSIHYSMARDMLKDLRKRMEAQERQPKTAAK